MTDRQAREDALREGLVGEERARLYHTNAIFRNQIDTLTQLLLVWAEGLASNAEEELVCVRSATLYKQVTPEHPHVKER